MSSKHIRLEIDNYKVAATVFVNNIVVFTNRFHQEPAANITINQWITNGNNQIRINLAINPQWFEDLKEQSFDMKIMMYEGTPESYSTTNLKEIHWKYTEDTLFPVNIIEEVTFDLPYGNWAWFDSDVLTDENFDLDTLKQYITTIHTALCNKDYNTLVPLLQTKSTELSAAYGIPLNERFADQKDFFCNELFNEPLWGMQMLNLDNLIFQYHANGHLVEVLDIKGKSPIQSTVLSDDVNFSIDLFLCHKNGQWILCR